MGARTKVDVAIVGGGPGGLAAAHAIHAVRPDLDVRVYERASELRRQGNLFLFFPNGQSALKAINPLVFQKLCESAIDFKGVRMTDFETVEELPPPHELMSKAFGQDSEAVMRCAWFVLRDTLASLLPNNWLQLGYSLQDVALQESGTALLTFSNRDEVVEAKIVIGCDGNKSTVRNCVLKDGDPKLMGTVIARGIIDAKDDWPHTKGVLCTFNTEQPISRMIASHLVQGTEIFGWNSLLPETLVEETLERIFAGEGADLGAQVKQRWPKELESWPQYIRDLVESTPPEQITLHRQAYRDPEDIKKWGDGCVTLLGDSAHLDTPALGLGVSMALEDAVALGRAVSELGPTEAALRQYEQARIPRVSKVHDESIQLFRRLVSKSDRKFGELQIEWHMSNPWCSTATFEPLSPTTAPSA